VLAMHYDIRLPRDYDMTVIRERVATRGHALDRLPGLGLKAYLVRDVANGAPLSSYSPLYLWTDEDAAARFLWGGGGFAGIVRDFTRPPVQTWVGGAFLPGAGVLDGPPTRALLTSTRLAPDAALEDVTSRARDLVAEQAALATTHSAAFLVDPASWTLTHVALHLDDVGHDPTPQTASFEVLHLSTPEIGALR
jgi:hypothetical protein